MNINDTTTINGEALSAQKSHADIIAECYHNDKPRERRAK